MGIKYYRDEAGNFIGGFENMDPPKGSIEVLEKDLPEGADMKFKGGKWVDTPESTARKAKTNYTIEHLIDVLIKKGVITLVDLNG